jgi:adenylate kinase
MARIRLRAFHCVTKPVLEFYQNSQKLVVIDGERSVAEVTRALRLTVEAVQGNAMCPVTRAQIETLLERIGGPVVNVPPAKTLDVVLVGAPGSGKGTQAENAAKVLQVPHVATGDLFRENLNQQTHLGKLARSYMDRGELVPDEITDAMVQQRLARPDVCDGFVLDGFPRTLHQAQVLLEILSEARRQVAGAIYLNVPDAEIVQRLSGRCICRYCQAPYHAQFKPPARPGICDICDGALYQREDDKPRTVLARLKAFQAHTEPVIRFYRRSGLLFEVDGTGTVQSVAARVIAASVEIKKRLIPSERAVQFGEPFKIDSGRLMLQQPTQIFLG